MAEEESDSNEKGGKKKFVIIAALLLLLIAGGAGAYLFLFDSKPAEESIPGTRRPTEQPDTTTNNRTESVRLTNPLFTQPRNYTVNLRDGKHFLKLSLVAVLEEPAAMQFLAERLPLVDDMVISLLHNMTTDDLRKPSGIDLLKRELFKKVNNIFTQEFLDELESKDMQPIKKILFKEFLIN